MKTSNIKFSSFDKSFSTPNGTFYAHKIELANGDTGQINAKEENPQWLRAGQELTYEITPNGKFPDKIKRVNPKFAGVGAGNKEGQLAARVDALEIEVQKLQDVIKSVIHNNKLVYLTPPTKPVQPKPQPEMGRYEKEIMDSETPF